MASSFNFAATVCIAVVVVLLNAPSFFPRYHQLPTVCTHTLYVENNK